MKREEDQAVEEEEEEYEELWNPRWKRRFLKEDPKEADDVPAELTGSFSTLPGEIFMDILSRLPLESLHRLLLVSKAWFFTIRHPRFPKLHLTVSNNNNAQSVILLEKRNGDYYLADHQVFDEMKMSARLYVPIIPDREMVDIESCNGLIFSHKPPFYITNPITGVYVHLPNPPPLWRRRATLSAFGFDCVNNKYKIIRILEKNCSWGAGLIAEIHTLGSREWRLILDVPYLFGGRYFNLHLHAACLIRFPKPGVFLNGAFHWKGFEKGNSIIVTFKLDTEEFGKIALPPGLVWQDGKIERNLFVLGECLCIFNLVSYDHFEIWVMEKCGVWRSWVRTVRNIYINNRPQGPCEPLQVMKNGEILLLCAHRVLGYYDPKTERIRFIRLLGIDSHKYALQPLVHTGSLISPRSICERTNRDGEGEDNYKKEEDDYAEYDVCKNIVLMDNYDDGDGDGDDDHHHHDEDENEDDDDGDKKDDTEEDSEKQ